VEGESNVVVLAAAARILSLYSTRGYRASIAEATSMFYFDRMWSGFKDSSSRLVSQRSQGEFERHGSKVVAVV